MTRKRHRNFCPVLGDSKLRNGGHGYDRAAFMTQSPSVLGKLASLWQSFPFANSTRLGHKSILTLHTRIVKSLFCESSWYFFRKNAPSTASACRGLFFFIQLRGCPRHAVSGAAKRYHHGIQHRRYIGRCKNYHQFIEINKKRGTYELNA